MLTTLEIKNLSKNFGSITAVDKVSLEFSKGKITALLGPNGAGKTTLMNMVSGYLHPSDGEIFVLGKSINEYPLEAKEQIGFLPEGSPLYPDMSVKQFLNYMAALRNVESFDSIIEQTQIKEVLNQKIETLSKGYLRRVGFAQSILHDPKILLLDEPTDGLDPNQKKHFRKLISDMSNDKTILITTHLLEEAENLASRIIIINRGKVLADGSVDEILKKTKTKSLDKAFERLTK